MRDISEYMDLRLRDLVLDLSERPRLYAWRNPGQEHWRFAVATRDSHITRSFGFDDGTPAKERRAFDKAVEAFRQEVFGSLSQGREP